MELALLALLVVLTCEMLVLLESAVGFLFGKGVVLFGMLVFLFGMDVFLFGAVVVLFGSIEGGRVLVEFDIGPESPRVEKGLGLLTGLELVLEVYLGRGTGCF